MATYDELRPGDRVTLIDYAGATVYTVVSTQAIDTRAGRRVRVTYSPQRGTTTIPGTAVLGTVEPARGY